MLTHLEDGRVYIDPLATPTRIVVVTISDVVVVFRCFGDGSVRGHELFTCCACHPGGAAPLFGE